MDNPHCETNIHAVLPSTVKNWHLPPGLYWTRSIRSALSTNEKKRDRGREGEKGNKVAETNYCKEKETHYTVTSTSSCLLLFLFLPCLYISLILNSHWPARLTTVLWACTFVFGWLTFSNNVYHSNYSCVPTLWHVKYFVTVLFIRLNCLRIVSK